MNFLTNLLLPKTQTTSKSTGLPPLKRNSRGIHLKSAQEIEKMRHSGKIVATVLKEIASIVKPGMTTAYLDEYAEQRIRELGCTHIFLCYFCFPCSFFDCVFIYFVLVIPSA